MEVFQSGPATAPKRWIFALVIFLAAGLLYAGSSSFGFLNLDDPSYVTHNPVVRGGLSATAIAKVFAEPQQNYYIPLTTLSLMADVSLHGLDAGGFHLSNALLHALNALLLFLFLALATGAEWKSFFAAALWALHPLRVESVAWVSARKDPLFLLFLLLAMIFWVNHAKGKGWGWYAAAFAAALASCLAKPAAVVIPFLLLAADFWPLERFSDSSRHQRALYLEKAPFLALSVFFSALALYTQASSLADAGAMTIADRLAQIATSYWHYIAKSFWPAALVLEDGNASWRMGGVAALLAFVAYAGISLAAWKLRESRPWLAFGWFWYLAALFPVSGVIPVGMNTLADRFTYLPAIGLTVAIVWGAGELCQRGEAWKRALATAAALLVAGFVAASYRQLGWWKDGETLFGRQIQVKDSLFTRKALADAYLLGEKYDKAIELLAGIRYAVPCDPKAARELGFALGLGGRPKEAKAVYEEAVSLDAANPDYLYELAMVELDLGDKRAAAENLEKALGLSPEHFRSLVEGAKLLRIDGRLAKAANMLERARAQKPDDAAAARELGFTYATWGMGTQAVKNLRDAVALEPGNAEGNLYLAVALLQGGDLVEPERYFRSALAVSPKNPAILYNYASLLERLGRKGEARGYYAEALSADPDGPFSNAARARAGALR